MMALSFRFGATWDEKVQHEYGELVFRYFASGFRDRAALAYKDLYLYGGLFDLLCATATRWIPADVSVTRHIITSMFGWIGIVYTGKLAGRLFGPAAGLLSMVMLTLSPRYFGDAMNNPKDIPFAAMAIMATYYLANVETAYPYLRWKNSLKVIAAIALAINIRAGGLLFLCYLGGLLVVLTIRERERNVSRLAATAGRFTAIGIASLCLGTLFWPWGQVQPLVRPFQALAALTHFAWPGFVLYRGQYLPATALPWHYPIVYLLITSPLVVLAGIGFSSVLFWKRHATAAAMACWFLVLFPLTYVVIRGATLYDGVRQLLFVYPPMVVLASGAWMGIVRETTMPRVAAMLLLAVGLADPLAFHVRNHPNQIVYFNALVGGPRGAFGRYDLDYWGNSMLTAVARSAEIATRASRRLVVSSGEPNDVVQADARRFGSLIYADWREGNDHLHIELLRGNPEKLTALLQSPTVYVVRTADGAPLCVIQPGPLYSDIGPSVGSRPAQ